MRGNRLKVILTKSHSNLDGLLEGLMSFHQGTITTGPKYYRNNQSINQSCIKCVHVWSSVCSLCVGDWAVVPNHDKEVVLTPMKRTTQKTRNINQWNTVIHDFRFCVFWHALTSWCLLQWKAGISILPRTDHGTKLPLLFSVGVFCNSCRGWHSGMKHLISIKTSSNNIEHPMEAFQQDNQYNRLMSASTTNNSARTPQTWISNLPHDHASTVQLMHCDAAPRDIVKIHLNADGRGDLQHSQALSCWLCKRLATLTGIDCAPWPIWDGCCTNAVTHSRFYISNLTPSCKETHPFASGRHNWTSSLYRSLK